MADSLLDWAAANEALFAPTTVHAADGDRVDADSRRSLSVHRFGPMSRVVREQMLAKSKELIELVKLSSVEIISAELELVAHGDGAFYGRHVDTVAGAHASAQGVRVISAVYYAFRRPKAFTGGEFRLYAFGPPDADAPWLDIEPEHNALLVFPAWAPHEVRPVVCPTGRFADARFAVNIWLYKELSSPIRSD